MTRTTARRSATALTAVALAAALGTPAYADRGGQPDDNASSTAVEATAEHGRPGDTPPGEPGSSADAPGHAGHGGHRGAPAAQAAPAATEARAADKPESKPAKPESKPGKPANPARPAAKPATRPAAARPAARPAAGTRPVASVAAASDGCKNPARPDQDGVGADRGIVNNDKTAPGADCNNGCGNDTDREDDNNGWCGKDRDRADVVESPRPAPATRATAVRTGTTAPTAPTAPTAAPAPRPVVRSFPDTRGGTGVAPASVAGVRVVNARPAPSALELATLPYTGNDAQTLMILGVVLVAGGLVVREIASSAEAVA